MPLKLYTSKKWLHKKYIIERLTEEEIAKMANTSQATINRWLKLHGLKRP
jgi:hypothetical protein